MICANLECLVPSHDQSCLLVLLVFQETNITSATFFPFPRISVEFEQFCAHLECLFLGFFIGLGLDLLGQMDDRLKMNIGRFLDFLRVESTLASHG